MTVSIQVLCKTREEMDQIRLDLMKEFDGLYDFNEEFIVKGKDKYHASFPAFPKENDHEEKLKKLSKKYTGVRFTFHDATITEGGDIMNSFDNYVDGEYKGNITEW